jgi:hypothetical protein
LATESVPLLHIIIGLSAALTTVGAKGKRPPAPRFHERVSSVAVDFIRDFILPNSCEFGAKRAKERHAHKRRDSKRPNLLVPYFWWRVKGRDA